jgi:hypothetical protein
MTTTTASRPRSSSNDDDGHFGDAGDGGGNRKELGQRLYRMDEAVRLRVGPVHSKKTLLSQDYRGIPSCQRRPDGAGASWNASSPDRNVR